MDESISPESKDGQTDSSNVEEMMERLAQSQHENMRLKNELDYLRHHSSSYEDSLNQIAASASMQENKVRR